MDFSFNFSCLLEMPKRFIWIQFFRGNFMLFKCIAACLLWLVFICFSEISTCEEGQWFVGLPLQFQSPPFHIVWIILNKSKNVQTRKTTSVCSVAICIYLFHSISNSLSLSHSLSLTLSLSSKCSCMKPWFYAFLLVSFFNCLII